MISYRYISGFLLTLSAVLTLCLFGADDVRAQEKLEVRASDHKNYSRLVFDWKSGATYSVEKKSDTLIVSFKKSASASIGNMSGAKNIGNVSLLSSEGEPPEFSVSIASDAKYRHFKIGNRVIIDVYDSSGKPSSQAVAAKSEPKKVEREVEEEAKNVSPAPSEADLEKPKQADLSRDAVVITVSSTRSLGMAVFERADYLWVVHDDPSLKIPPTVSGDGKNKIGKFEEVKTEAGKAYRLPKPLGSNFYGEGGGLLWRVVMTPNPRNAKPLKMETREANNVDGVNRSIYWPLETVRKVLDIKDPVVGDVIKVVTVGDTGQTIGPARRLVEMEILKSSVGMAIVPYIDELDINVSEGGITLSQASGLAVSPLSDTASLVLADDIEKEDDVYDRIKNPRDMTKIFDFSRWEMGGKRALDKNRRILMVAAANKQGNTKVEDLITMAKLNLANDRGQEALGLLRVAENELPGIQDTPEFLALRGAAGTLAGKYDQAIEDLTSPALERFDEINYWKAGALAGLEDWQQADKIMPNKFNVLEEYPEQIKQPLTLAMTEVALRAGNVNIAERLLSLLEPSFNDMSISRQSAWKYLQGELERQADNPEQTLKNWDTLLTGKDDYYRAKAGLSVTRMQLERQKITAAQAIDRLEGLRYAWRGDELETAINYRLGQVYIEDSDYLKGLSVLRNAVGLSPNSKISEEVTDYMTQTFRRLFTDGTLEKVSPLDAITIYDEFKELTPVGREGDVFVQNLAERLVNVDLLGRAAALLEDQMNYRLKGQDRAQVGIRLAAIHLLDNKAGAALAALDIAKSADNGALSSEIRLLRARAYSNKGEANKALRLLQGLPSSEKLAKLRAEISWNGGLWNDAANAFKNLISYQSISKTRPMDEYQENLILNRAIALNLSNNRTALATMRSSYGDLMKQSEKAQIFELVTRPRQLGVLEDRESIKSLISEVNFFGEFLETYKNSK